MADLTRAEVVERAALRWCGEKDRETFLADKMYFIANWQALPGLRAYVERELSGAPNPLAEETPDAR